MFPKKKERVDLTQQRSVCIPLKESAITLIKEMALWINLARVEGGFNCIGILIGRAHTKALYCNLQNVL